jgi:protein phosphatase
VEPSFYQLQISPGDWLVVCSDGLSTHISTTEIGQVLASSMNAEQASRKLVNLANGRGGFDNCTVVVIAAR